MARICVSCACRVGARVSAVRALERGLFSENARRDQRDRASRIRTATLMQTAVSARRMRNGNKREEKRVYETLSVSNAKLYLRRTDAAVHSRNAGRSGRRGKCNVVLYSQNILQHELRGGNIARVKKNVCVITLNSQRWSVLEHCTSNALLVQFVPN